MEFGEKLQQLRKQKGITQQALADALFVSRTAVSKWESSRGYPEIGSLRAIARFFGVTVDALLSSDEILSLAEDGERRQGKRFRALALAISDALMGLLLFLPLFAERSGGEVLAVSLLSSAIRPGLRVLYAAVIVLSMIVGILSESLRNISVPFFTRRSAQISIFISASAALLFILGLHPYAASFTLALLCVKLSALFSGK